MSENRLPEPYISGVVQHSSWLQRTLPPVEQLLDDLWSIPVPMPHSPLRYVSVYVLAGDAGLTLIDAGWDGEESWTALRRGLDAIGASIADVRGALITHQHLDHIGLASRVQQASGAWIALHPADRDAIMRPDFRQPLRAARADAAWLISLGASADEARRLSADRPGRDPRSRFAIPDRLIEDGEDVGVPGWSLRAVHTPGHTPGHLCFVDESRQLLFAGDHVLPRITPNISADRRPEVDALGDFLSHWPRSTPTTSRRFCPLTNGAFAGCRAEPISSPHTMRADSTELLAIVRRHPGSVPWELAGGLTWSRPWDQYAGYMRVAAVGETTAHLVLLRNRGLITATHGPIPRYTAVASLRH